MRQHLRAAAALLVRAGRGQWAQLSARERGKGKERCCCLGHAGAAIPHVHCSHLDCSTGRFSVDFVRIPWCVEGSSLPLRRDPGAEAEAGTLCSED